MKSHADAYENGRAKCSYWRFPNLIALVEQILDCDEGVNRVRDTSRNQSIQTEIGRETKEILVVIEL